MAHHVPASPRADSLRISAHHLSVAQQTPTSPKGQPTAPAERTSLPRADVAESRGPLIPVADWNQRHAWPPIGGLRHLIFHASSNGFDKVIRRVGRRVLINETAFFEWVDQQKAASR